MNGFPPIRCPSCKRELGGYPAAAQCGGCGRTYQVGSGVLELDAIEPVEPSPASVEAIDSALARARRGEGYKECLEHLLLELRAERADALMLLLKESRGAWSALLDGGAGEALFTGNALSGSIPALAMMGMRVTIVDRSARRLALGQLRNDAYAPERTRAVLPPAIGELPFPDASFDLVVTEGGVPPGQEGATYPVRELGRVCRGELAITADNRLGYKRSTGLRGRYHVPGPLEYLVGAARPRRGERTLWGYRKLVSRTFKATRAYALYPDAREFSHVVGLDSERPRLTIGPRERKNRLKLVARSLGLFPVFTPSFAIVARKDSRARPYRLQRMLDALAERLDERVPEVDILVATRSNSCLVHTEPRREPGPEPGPEPEVERGRWTLHLPMSPAKRASVERHHTFLVMLRERFPGVPVPEPLFLGELEGTWLACERRLGGLTSPHYTGELTTTRRMFLDAARHTAELVVERDTELTGELFDRVVGTRFEVVHRLAAVESTRRRLERMLAEARERLVGRTVPLVVSHGDLRGKHVQIRADGSVVGYLDWGASEVGLLPYVDLVHLVAHQRKQEEKCSSGRSWELLRDRTELREHERDALDACARDLGIDAEVRGAIEAIYPILVGGMSELNWDYSRPRWVHQHFGI